ncbi:hypothetical protein C2G38_2200495 [Gigaspora rosea]|uniref:Uncharacterized protein n=1 Tax=Gigaspora rosea TaxID=44941 RepID=A0A397UZ56_9GLOM|nr:hypothetical protein C2G38_2200495 [Gigaspora rosea]
MTSDETELNEEINLIDLNEPNRMNEEKSESICEGDSETHDNVKEEIIKDADGKNVDLLDELVAVEHMNRIDDVVVDSVVENRIFGCYQNPVEDGSGNSGFGYIVGV